MNNIRDCEINPCVEDATCIQTEELRACECNGGYTGSGYQLCKYIPPSKLTTLITGLIVPIEIPPNISKYNMIYQTSRTVVENFMDPVLSNLNGYIPQSIHMIGVKYVSFTVF